MASCCTHRVRPLGARGVATFTGRLRPASSSRRPLCSSTSAARARHPPPPDAAARRAAPAVICYAVENLPPVSPALFRAREALTKVDEVVVPPRDGRCFEVPAGHFFRITSVEGPQVGDLNLFNLDNVHETFYSSKTRQLHATHLTTGCRMWSGFPAMRPMATITHDTLDWCARKVFCCWGVALATVLSLPDTSAAVSTAGMVTIRMGPVSTT